MRVCLGFLSHDYTMVTSASSEPLLAEAALSATYDFAPCKTLEHYVRDSVVRLGDRGELIAAEILLGAVDKARKADGSTGYEDGRGVLLSDFFKALFPADIASGVENAMPSRVRSDDELKPLKERLPRARIWFNHFVKVHSPRVLNRKYLWRLLVRGAAAICTNHQAGADVALPYVVDDTLPVGRNNVGILIVPVKNDGRFSVRPHLSLFHVLNPYKLGIYDRDETDPPPVIRMVFALAASAPCVHLVEIVEPAQHEAARAGIKLSTLTSGDKKPTDKPKVNRQYTAYDIWCGRASSKTFGYIRSEHDLVYDNLLRLSMRRPSQHALGIEPAVQAHWQRLHPAEEEDPAHWAQWIDVPDITSAPENDGTSLDSDL
jgi:hypothetical protein